MKKVLSPDFFNPPALTVAPLLLGKFLVRKLGQQTKVLMITEVEAYDGFKDKASHAARGLTERNKIMFGEAGRWYVYFTYGLHWMLNVVTGPKGYPAAVLIRGVEGINGPAKITKALKINKSFNGRRIARESGLWLEDRGIKIEPFQIIRTKRVGVEYAGRYWSNRKYRFLLR
jgi:DNA-3-methyladenine glycosylase